MCRRGSELEPARWGSMVLLLMGLVSFCMVYIFMSTVMRPSSSPDSKMGSLGYDDGSSGGNSGNSELETSGVGGCCRGIPNMELWGPAVKWGTDFKFNSSEQCCKACKAMCTGKDGPCLCDSWVFCGNKEAFGEKFGEGLSSGVCCVTALIEGKEMVVSNLGDCRAVLCRDGVADAITTDHTPELEDERRRIEANGGYVEIHRGTWRVHGTLAISRSIGDAHLKDCVMAVPEAYTHGRVV